jgi:hypothetical protein
MTVVGPLPSRWEALFDPQRLTRKTTFEKVHFKDFLGSQLSIENNEAVSHMKSWSQGWA